jgi:hypothetical protein
VVHDPSFLPSPTLQWADGFQKQKYRNTQTSGVSVSLHNSVFLFFKKRKNRNTEHILFCFCVFLKTEKLNYEAIHGPLCLFTAGAALSAAFARASHSASDWRSIDLMFLCKFLSINLAASVLIA